MKIVDQQIITHIKASRNIYISLEAFTSILRKLVARISGGGPTPTLKAFNAQGDEDGWPPLAGTKMWT
ncbi:MAG: hypothetical protein QW175_04495 [Candidatus Bathyarchaeia archaeon]